MFRYLSVWVLDRRATIALVFSLASMVHPLHGPEPRATAQDNEQQILEMLEQVLVDGDKKP